MHNATAMKTVLFACTHNAGRSQIAAAFFNELADPTLARGISAGTKPAESVHPEVVLAMKKVGIDLGEARPRKLTWDMASEAHLLVTMGCGDRCPVVPGLRVLDWPVSDPQGQDAAVVHVIRDDIWGRVRELVLSEGWSSGVSGEETR